jgi:hypothetical protein
MESHIIDRAWDEPTTLEIFRLVSKPWAHYARKHILVKIEFRPFVRHVSRRRETFPDPTDHPAHNTRITSIHDPQSIAVAYVDMSLTSSGVVRLCLDTWSQYDEGVSLFPFKWIFPSS